eukprot:TRINITY_DN4454_c0_g1_i2.p1 TRINITY_DN4454_c0_g1~~TRINITY_DN4454_c0_g1_i2.p1  ORF type:complete len:753 (-),score=198.88 TRINITY_DN4454_c0_g1_i2:179-2437(-)
MAFHVDPQVANMLTQEVEEFLDVVGRSNEQHRERVAKRINLILNGLSRKLKLGGEVHMFGSFSNGFKTGTSDLDVVLVGNMPESETPVSILGKFAEHLADLGFENITKIFQANVPLLKLSDMRSDMEVDFCVNNKLGVRNSLLLNMYCKCDPRVLHLGRLVKDWAKKHEIVGTADGCLNSYAYMLLVIFFLQNVQPPVVPNLQAMDCESYTVSDRKWGGEDLWETKFCSDVELVPKSQNTMNIGELLLRFFNFYAREFNWRSHAVCMRLFRPGQHTDKYSLMLPTNDEQWYVEDPFDLKHNLAGKCSRAGKKRIIDEMHNALSGLTATGMLSNAFPSTQSSEYFMKCRISQAVTPQALLEEFEEFDLVKLHFPKPESNIRLAQAFLQFGDAASRRRAHTKNEKYIADCQLMLHYSTQHSLAEAVAQGSFSTYEMASYKMQRQVLAARVSGGQALEQMGPPGLSQQMGMGYKESGMQEAVPYPLFGQRPPPPPPPMQQTPQMMWEQNQVNQMDQMQKMQMQQMHMHKMPQMQQVQAKSAQMAGMYGNQQSQVQWQQQQQQMWQQHQQMQQQMPQPPMVPPPNTQAQQQLHPPPAPHALQKDAKKEDPKETKKAKAEAKAKLKAEAKEAKAKAAAAKAKEPTPVVPAAKPKQAAAAPALGSAGAGWLEVKIENNLPAGKHQIFTSQQMDTIKVLQNFYSRFSSDTADRRQKQSEVKLEMELKDDRKQNGQKVTPLFSSDQWQMLQKLKLVMDRK